MIGDAIAALDWAILVYFLVVNTFYAVLLTSAGIDQRQQRTTAWRESTWRLLSSPAAPTLTILAPAHNEASTVAQSVRALLTLRYPRLQIVVVNDGSTDTTLDVLRRELELEPATTLRDVPLTTAPVRALYRSRRFPQLLVVDKDNGGKADALNAGLNIASGDLVCAIDVDTLIEPDALLKLARPFLHRDDVIAAGGTVRVINGSVVRGGRVVAARVPRHPLAGFQTVEYLRAFLFGRVGWNRLGGNLIISGAFGLFRREALLATRGYEHESVGEDMELVARLRREALEHGRPHHVESVPDPVAWTEVPESLRVLGRQRDRWQRGLADVLWRHRRMLFNPRYRAVGMVVVPYFTLVELLAPVVELLGLAGLIVALLIDAVDIEFAVLFFLVAYGYGLLLNGFTLLLADFGERRYLRLRDRALLVPWAVLDAFAYRPLTVVWRLRGLVRYLRGRRDWGTMTRRGFTVGEEPPHP